MWELQVLTWLPKKGLARGWDGVGGAGRKGQGQGQHWHLLCSRAVSIFAFILHITLGTTPPAPGSGLKDPIFHELNECKEKVKPIARNLSWSREVIRKSESPNTLVLTAASLAGHLSPNRDSRGSVRSPALRKYLRCAGWPAALARQEKGAG